MNVVLFDPMVLAVSLCLDLTETHLEMADLAGRAINSAVAQGGSCLGQPSAGGGLFVGSATFCWIVVTTFCMGSFLDTLPLTVVFLNAPLARKSADI